MSNLRTALAAAVTCLCVAFAQASSATAVTIYVDSALRQNVGATMCSTDPDTIASLSKYSVLEGLAYGANKVYMVFGVPSSHALHEQVGGTVLTKWSLGASSATCDGAQENLDLGHGNDIAYVSSYAGAASLLIPKGTKSHPSSTVVRLTINTGSSQPLFTVAGSLQFTNSTGTVLDASGICYSSVAGANGRYAIRAYFSSSNTNYVYSYAANSNGTQQNTNPEDRIKMVDPAGEDGKQGLDCSGSNVYDVRSIAGTSNKTNYVYQYAWGAADGSPSKTLTYKSSDPLKPTNSSSEEVEGVFHKGDQFYMGVNRNGSSDRLCTIRWSGSSNSNGC